jgi:ribosomal protein S18 acetylase RimI-like enzyme
MQFELTEALMDDILFSMEDQDGEFYVDTRKGVVAGGLDYYDEDADTPESDDEEGRYISMPDWDSSSGFRLMERFAAGFRNPIIREELSSALNRGRGVFRAFKNVLTRHPEAEKLWFSYKEREMKREIIRWYNALREEWGLEKIGLEPEETDDLVLEDFRFREFGEDDIEQAKELHSCCREEKQNWMRENGIPEGEEKEGLGPESSRTALSDGEGASGSPPAKDKKIAVVAESGNGEFSGFISAALKGAAVHIQTLEVKPEYRGMGIGEALLTKMLEKIDGDTVSQVLFDLPAGSEGFSRVLIREEFKPYITRYCLDLRKRLG